MRIDDVTNNKTVHDHRNLSLVEGVWKFPNAFTNTRSKTKLIVSGSNHYKWTLTLNASTPKQFVRFNFNTINYTSLSKEEKQVYWLNVSLDVGPHRKCELKMQNFDIWKASGQKIDNFFECESLSDRDYREDSQWPVPTMVMHTQVSGSRQSSMIDAFIVHRPIWTYPTN